MAVPYVSIHARLLGELAAYLAAGPAVQDFLGVSTPEAARALIVEVDGQPLSARHLILASPRLRGSRTPGRRFTGTAQLGILICAPPSVVAADEVQREALNWYTPLLSWAIEFPRTRDFEDTEPIRLDASDGLTGWMMAGIDLTADVVL